MKLLPNKTFPHPVLWKNADDYTLREFQAVRSFSIKDDVPVLSYNFMLNEECIDDLVKKKKATYALEIYCPTTFVRRTLLTHEKAGEFVLKKGDLYRRVEVNAFVVCTKNIQKYFSPNFNDEFGDSSFHLLEGDVLATDDTQIYYWDTECVAPLHSVFELVSNDNVSTGMFFVDTCGDKIKIQMHSKDKSRFDHIRKSQDGKPIAMFVYFSVVAEVLRQMKEKESDGGEDKRWYRTIEHKLEDMNRNISSDSVDPFIYAQKLLCKPLRLILPQLSQEA